MSDGNGADRNARMWASFVAVLSTMTDVIERLSTTHVPDSDGRCQACTRPGHGTPYKPWPCSLWSLANDARSYRARATGEATTADRRTVDSRHAQRP